MRGAFYECAVKKCSHIVVKLTFHYLASFFLTIEAAILEGTTRRRRNALFGNLTKARQEE